jgi:hypothetical protein
MRAIPRFPVTNKLLATGRIQSGVITKLEVTNGKMD